MQACCGARARSASAPRPRISGSLPPTAVPPLRTAGFLRWLCGRRLLVAAWRGLHRVPPEVGCPVPADSGGLAIPERPAGKQRTRRKACPLRWTAFASPCRGCRKVASRCRQVCPIGSSCRTMDLAQSERTRGSSPPGRELFSPGCVFWRNGPRIPADWDRAFRSKWTERSGAIGPYSSLSERSDGARSGLGSGVFRHRVLSLRGAF